MNSSTSWFSNALSFSNARILSPVPCTFNLFHIGFTNNISYSLGINNSSTHCGKLFICLSPLIISNPSNSCIIFCFFGHKDFINILSKFCFIYFFFFNPCFMLNICNPSNSCIWFRSFGLGIIDVTLISSIFWIIKSSLSFSLWIIYSSFNSEYFLDKIEIDCKCWHILLYILFFDIILKAFISWISRTPSESDTDSFPALFKSDFELRLIDSIWISFIGEGIIISFQVLLSKVLPCLSLRLVTKLFNSWSFSKSKVFNLFISSSYSSKIIVFCDILLLLFPSEIQLRLSTVEQKLSSFQIFLIIFFTSDLDISLKGVTLFLLLLSEELFGLRKISIFLVSIKYLLLSEGEEDKLPGYWGFVCISVFLVIVWI